MTRYETIEEVKKHGSEAKTFDEVLKFNPYHGYHGYFSTAEGATSMTFRTRDPAKQHWADAAMAREKERSAASGGARKPLENGKKLGRFEQYEPMTREQANEGHVNPNYKSGEDLRKTILEQKEKQYVEAMRAYENDLHNNETYKAFDKARSEYMDAQIEFNSQANQNKPYHENCQSAVVAYEARLRGYDVTAKPWERQNGEQYALAMQTNRAWYDPNTGSPSSAPARMSANTASQIKSNLESTVKPGERYTMEFTWKNRNGGGGHIICVDRDASGGLRLYDPQVGKTITGSGVDEYLKDVRTNYKSGNKRFIAAPKLLRVDNLEIDPNVANAIFEEANHG